MKTAVVLMSTLATLFAGGSVWAAVPEIELVIEPGIADSDDLVKISVPNSACYYDASVDTILPAHTGYNITLSYGMNGGYEQCLAQNPDAPDFETTIGPLTPGEYGFVLRTHTGGFLFTTADSQSLLVVEAPPPASLSGGGINGLYHRPDSPHQYFYVLETVYNTLLVWNTFDADGNQLWVYGVGDQYNGGQSVVTEAYINRSIGFLPGGEPEIEAEPWGSIRVDLSSCTEGVVTYQSDLPEFESGQFPIVRLAYSKQIGCENPE